MDVKEKSRTEVVFHIDTEFAALVLIEELYSKKILDRRTYQEIQRKYNKEVM